MAYYVGDTVFATIQRKFGNEVLEYKIEIKKTNVYFFNLPIKFE